MNKPKTFAEGIRMSDAELFRCVNDYNIMKLKDPGSETTLAHECSRREYRFPMDDKILKLKTKSGWTVAHDQVFRGFFYDEQQAYLRWKNVFGITVAHVQASAGYVFPKGSPLLKLRDQKGRSVADVQRQYELDHPPELSTTEN